MLYLFVSLVLIITSLLYLKIAKKYNIVDKPNYRSSHNKPIIRGAGILFYIAAVIFFFVSGYKYPYFMLGLSLISIVSYVDDLITLSSKFRLVFQFISIILVTYQSFLFAEMTLLILPFLIIIGVGFINIYNFMDGINGITGMYSIMVFVSLYVINYFENIIDARLLIFVLISILIFGFFNFRKNARFFCGDIGSISIATIIYYLLLVFIIKLEAPLLVLLVGVYGADSILTILYRKYIKENIMEPHRHHLYQKLTDISGFTHLKISGLYSLVQFMIAVIVLVGYKKGLNTQLLVFFGVISILVFLYISIFQYLKRHEIK